ncbi:MAG TPA: inositol monophosphatase family protein [Steroidobacteraceae bacterium]|jgi:histidinol-phosphatase|nr:inositol monophosphatase family protein [Steroidobacteraceae bacterium]
MPPPNQSPQLVAALAAARAADAVIGPLYRSNLVVETKADRSPVTEADRRAEAAIREVLAAAFPDYGFYGEETGQHAMDAEYIWLVDPLDGTKSFVRDTPFFSTQIALMHRGRLVLGVSSACAYQELAWAEEGGGAWLNGEPIKVSATAVLADAILSTGNLKTLANTAKWGRFGDLVRQVYRLRGYGDFVHYHLLARGAVDVVIESDVNILDIAALSVIVSEAGGRVTDLSGGEIGLATTTVLASNGLLHDLAGEAMDYRYKR